jgi:dihydroorotase
VAIHNLALNDNDVGEYRTFFRLAPPLRAEEDRLAMIEALRDGTVDLVCSSHDPQDVDTKRLPFADAAAGAIGLETLLAVTLRLYHNGDLTLLRVAEILSANPARIFGLPGGGLAPGMPADLILVDLDQPWIVREAEILSRSKNSCFEGARLQGKVLQTMVAGRTVFRAREGADV